MKKRVFAIVTITLVLIGLIFFTVKNMPRQDKYEGVLVKEDQYSGWQEV